MEDWNRKIIKDSWVAPIIISQVNNSVNIEDGDQCWDSKIGIIILKIKSTLLRYNLLYKKNTNLRISIFIFLAIVYKAVYPLFKIGYRLFVDVQ